MSHESVDTQLLRELREARAQVAALTAQCEGLRKALIAYRKAQRSMRDKWAEGDDNVKADLWRSLHACEELADSAIAARNET